MPFPHRRVVHSTLPVTPGLLLPSAGLVVYYRSAVGVTASAWTDLSGNGSDAAQATAGRQPALAHNLNGLPTVHFAGSRFYTCPDVFPTTSAWAKLALVRFDAVSGANNILSGGNGGTGHALYLASSVFPNMFDSGNSGVVVTGSLALAPGTWYLIEAEGQVQYNLGIHTGNQALYTLRVNNAVVGTGPPSITGQNNSNTDASLSVGMFNATGGSLTNALTGDLAEAAVRDHAWSAADRNLIAARFNAAYQFSLPQVLNQITILGDSIAAGSLAAPGAWWQLAAVDNPLRGVTNLAAPGARTANLTTVVSGPAAQLYSAGLKNIAVLQVGTNDLADGTSGAATYTLIATQATALKALGYTVIGVTVLPRTGINEAQRQIVDNAMVAAAGSTFDIVADVRNDPTIGAAGANLNLTYYSDGTHPTAAGDARLWTLIIQPALVTAGW